MRLSSARRRTLAVLAAAFFASACSDSPSQPANGPAAAIEAVFGDEQSGTAGAQLSQPIVVLVTDSEDRPVPNQAVTFVVVAGGGSVDGASATTSSLGIAQVRWTLGTAAETAQRLEARAVRGNGSTIVSTVITAAAGPAPAASLATVNWNGAGMAERMVVPIPVSVRVVDQFGNPVHGAPVTFAVTAGDGTITGATTTSGGQGIATLGSWTLGGAGINTVTATSGTLAPVTFTTNARSTTPARLVLSGGQDQTAQVGTSVPQPLSVIVQNEAGEFVQGATVTFTPGPNSGNVHIATAVSGPTGIATLNGWFLANVAGPQTLVASVSPAGSFTFNATATPGPAARLAKRAGDNQVAYAGEPVPVAPSVFVQDVYGNRVAGGTVTFSVYNGGGTVTGATVTSDANGIATVGSWTLGSIPGTQTLRATMGNEEVSFTASANSRGAVQLVLDTRTPTSASAGATITIYVKAVDAVGGGVANVSVNFAPLTSHSGQGTVLDPSQLTNAEGVASVQYIMPTNVYAPGGVTASSSGLQPLTVNVTTTAGTASQLVVTLADNSVVAGANIGQPAFTVLNENGASIAGFPVRFTVIAGGGTVNDSTQYEMMTNMPPTPTTTGPMWKSGPVAGANTLEVSTPTAPGVPKVVLTRTTTTPP